MAVDRRAQLEVGGPLKAWREKRRRCPVCATPIVRGPVEMCGGAQPHAIELRLSDLHQPLGPRERRMVEQGYWWRWLLGLLGAVMLLLAIACSALASAGLLAPIVPAIFTPFSVLLVLLALLFSPPILWRPTPDRVMREFRAAEPTAPDDTRA